MFVALLDNIRSAYNVGSIFRTSDCAGIDAILITGYTAHPPHPKVEKTSLGAESTVPWLYQRDPIALINQVRSGTLTPEIKSENWAFASDAFCTIQIAACELTPEARNIYTEALVGDHLLIFGNEVEGVQPELLAAADVHLKIPMFGHKDSLNVASSYAILAYEYVRQRENFNK